MYHKITIAGNLGGDPEMRYLPDGTAVTNFNVAVSDGFGENKKTMWIRVTIWRKRAEVANQYLSKGSRVLVEGRLNSDDNGRPRLYTHQDGTVGSSFEMTATDFVFLSSRQEAAEYAAQSGDSMGGGGGASSSQPAVEEDDSPF